MALDLSDMPVPDPGREVFLDLHVHQHRFGFPTPPAGKLYPVTVKARAGDIATLVDVLRCACWPAGLEFRMDVRETDNG